MVDCLLGLNWMIRSIPLSSLQIIAKRLLIAWPFCAAGRQPDKLPDGGDETSDLETHGVPNPNFSSDMLSPLGRVEDAVGGVDAAAAANGAASAREDELETEPSWELPTDLQKYQGDPGDRKAMLVFRQEQQLARQVRHAKTSSP